MHAPGSCVPSLFVWLNRIHHLVEDKRLCRLRIALAVCSVVVTYGN